MIGTAKELWICGKKIALGDYVEVEYTTGDRMKGGRIKGTVTELWNPEDHEGHHQAQLSCGWCFHPGDRILVHIPNARLDRTAASAGTVGGLVGGTIQEDKR